jgi:single-strand DNA-binding protein
MGANSVIIEGNLTRDVELRYTCSGTAIASLSIAYNDKYTKGTEEIKQSHFFDVTAFKDVAEGCAKLSKGTLIRVEGKLVQDRWEKDGKTQSKVKIIAFSVEDIKKGNNSSNGNTPQGDQGSPAPRPSAPQGPHTQPAHASPPSDGFDDQIPF